MSRYPILPHNYTNMYDMVSYKNFVGGGGEGGRSFNFFIVNRMHADHDHLGDMGALPPPPPPPDFLETLLL